MMRHYLIKNSLLLVLRRCFQPLLDEARTILIGAELHDVPINLLDAEHVR